MSQRHSDGSLDEKSKLLEYRFHSELRLDKDGNPVSGLPTSRSSLRSFQEEHPPGEPHSIILSTESPAALKMGTQQLIPKSLAVSTKAKTPTRHQSFAVSMLSKDHAQQNLKRMSVPSFSRDDLDMDVTSEGMLKRNLRNQSYRAAMKGFQIPAEAKRVNTLKPLAEESTQGRARSPGRSKVKSVEKWPALAGLRRPSTRH